MSSYHNCIIDGLENLISKGIGVIVPITPIMKDK